MISRAEINQVGDVERQNQEMLAVTERVNVTNLEEPNISECLCRILCLFCGFWIIFAYIACLISFLVFSVISLCRTSYYDQKALCLESNAWIFVISIIIFNSAILPRENDGKNMKYIQLIISCSFTIWSIHEFFFISCVSNLKGTLLYTILEIDVIIGIVGTFLICLFMESQHFIGVDENT